MNIENNHLITFEGEFPPEGYQPIPPELLKVAERALKGRSETVISKHSGGKLSKWAAQQRKQKRKVAKETKRRNRKK